MSLSRTNPWLKPAAINSLVSRRFLPDEGKEFVGVHMEAELVGGKGRAFVAAVFAYLWQMVVDSAPVGSETTLVVVSPLAEGADRLIAHEAVANGFPLYCPLPFDRDTYERDFASPASRAKYRRLLARAVAVEELPGSHATSNAAEAAYTAVDRIVVEQSELSIALWDGEAARGQGGTASVVEDARVSCRSSG